MSSLAPPPGSTVELIADPSCPWCYVGFRRLLALARQTPITIRWRPFLLDPNLPAEGVERQLYLGRKFGSPEAARRLHRRVAEVAAGEGIVLAMERIARTPSTLGAQMLLLEAQRQGRLPAMAERLFHAHLVEGIDIGDPARLAELAAGLALELPGRPAEAEAMVLASHRAAVQAGVSGVPVFVLGEHTVAGAQPVEVLEALLDLARYQASRPLAWSAAR